MTDKFLSSPSGNSDIFENPSETRAKLGLIFGATIQSYDNTLNALSNLSITNNTIIKGTGTDQFTTLPISTHGETALNSSEALLTSSNLTFTPSSTDTLTNKSISASDNSISGLNNSNIANGAGYITANSTNTLTNKSISAGNNTITGLDNTNITNSVGYITANSSDTLTNKSISYSQITETPTNLLTTNTAQQITAEKIIDQANSGELGFTLNSAQFGQNVNTYLKVQAHANTTTSDKEFILPSLNIGSNSDTLCGLSSAQTLTNKTMDFNNNSFTNFPNGLTESDNTTFTGTIKFQNDSYFYEAVSIGSSSTSPMMDKGLHLFNTTTQVGVDEPMFCCEVSYNNRLMISSNTASSSPFKVYYKLQHNYGGTIYDIMTFKGIDGVCDFSTIPTINGTNVIKSGDNISLLTNNSGYLTSSSPILQGLWSGSGDIYYTGGDVGIGTTSPETLLTVGNHPQTDGTRDLVRFSSYRHNEAFTIRNNDDSSNGRLEFFWGNSRNGSGGHDNTVDKSVLTLQHTGKVAINGSATGEGILTVNTSTNYWGIKLMDGTTPLAKLAKYADSGYSYYYGSAPSSIGGSGISYIGGRLGVNGITNPDCGLEVEVTNTVAIPSGRAYWYNGEQGHSAFSRVLAIHAHGAVWSDNSTGFIATSDRRIKKNIVDVPDNLALEMVRNIPCRYYEYKDNLYSGTDKTIGFIAQEVAEVLPMAISIQTSIIPNELRKLENVSWEQIENTYKLITDLQDDVSGVKYRFYVSNDVSGNDEIKKEIIGNSDNSFTFDSSYNNVFIYGKEVDDFHTLDKQKIFALHHSAIQELDKQIQLLKEEIKLLKSQ